jgi:hypothetical protein
MMEHYSPLGALCALCDTNGRNWNPLEWLAEDVDGVFHPYINKRTGERVVLRAVTMTTYEVQYDK